MKPFHAGLTALFLVACSSEEPPPGDVVPPVSPALDLVLARPLLRPTTLRVYFEQPDVAACDASDFLQPGEFRRADDVSNPCQIATCVSELRLVRGEQIVEIVRVDPESPGGTFREHAGETGLELEILGCGAPRRLPLWQPSQPLGGQARVVPGDPVSIAVDGAGGRVSLLSDSSGFPFRVSRHTEAGADRVGVELGRSSSYVTVDVVEKGEESDLDGLHVRRWSSETIVETELALPVETKAGWDIGNASTGPAEVTLLSASGAATTIRLSLRAASLDRPDERGLLSWRADASPSSPELAGFELAQGATNDTLRLVHGGKTYEAITPHVAPASPLDFGLEGDSTFRVGFPALRFVNVADAEDFVDSAGLRLSWELVHLVPLT